jgi:hypothetical protein
MCAYPHQMSVEHARYAFEDFIKENLTRKGYGNPGKYGTIENVSV